MNASIAKIRGESPAEQKNSFLGKEPMIECRAARGRREIAFCFANAIKPMSLIEPGWAQKGKFPEFPEWTINASNLKEEGAYVRSWMKEIGLDRIIAFANRGEEAVKPKDAMAAIEKCAGKYKRASVQAFHQIPEFYVMAAMALTYQRFRELKLSGFAGRTLHAMNIARSKAGDPTGIATLKEMMNDQAKQGKESPGRKALYISDVIPVAESAVMV